MSFNVDATEDLILLKKRIKKHYKRDSNNLSILSEEIDIILKN